MELEYKLLNAELMDQVQKLKIEVGEYRKALVKAQAQVFEEHEALVVERHFWKGKIKNAVKMLLGNMEEGLESLHIENGGSDTASTENMSRRSERRLSNNHDIFVQFRRSNSLAGSFDCRPSPSRRSSLRQSVSSTENESNNASPELGPSLQPRRVAELEAFDSSLEEQDISSASNKEQSPNSDRHVNAQLCSIIEETDTEVRETSSKYDITAYKPSTPRTMRTRQYAKAMLSTQSPLSDISNMTLTPSPKITIRRGNRHQPSPLNEDSKVTDTIVQQVRHASSCTTVVDISICEISPQKSPIANDENLHRRRRHTSHECVDVDLTPGRKSLDVSSGFAHMPNSTSTPYLAESEKCQKSKNKTMPTRVKKNLQSSKSDLENSSCEPRQSRPRGCRPSFLKEPDTRTKMRNDGGRVSKKK